MSQSLSPKQVRFISICFFLKKIEITFNLCCKYGLAWLNFEESTTELTQADTENWGSKEANSNLSEQWEQVISSQSDCILYLNWAPTWKYYLCLWPHSVSYWVMKLLSLPLTLGSTMWPNLVDRISHDKPSWPMVSTFTTFPLICHCCFLWEKHVKDGSLDPKVDKIRSFKNFKFLVPQPPGKTPFWYLVIDYISACPFLSIKGIMRYVLFWNKKSTQPQ